MEDSKWPPILVKAVHIILLLIGVSLLVFGERIPNQYWQSAVVNLGSSLISVTLVFIIYITFNPTLRVSQREEPPSVPSEGKIVEPIPNAVLSREFSYRVELSNPNPNNFYYLVHEVSGQYWPKAWIKPAPKGRPISGQSSEGGGGIPPNRIFHIVLFEVNKAEHRRIKKWLRGPFSAGIPIEEGRQLDKIKVVLG